MKCVKYNQWSKSRLSGCMRMWCVWTGWCAWKKKIPIWAMRLHLEPWHNFRAAAPVLLATTQSAPPTVHHVGMSLRKIIWNKKAKTTSIVFIIATSPAFSIWMALVRNTWPPKPNSPISMRKSLSNPQYGRLHSPNIKRTMTHSRRPSIT